MTAPLRTIGLLPYLVLSLLVAGCSDAPPGGQAASVAWPAINYDLANSRDNRSETKLSPENVSRLTPRWRLDGLSAVTSTPAVVDGAVYFGDWSGVFHALDARDGTEIWSRKLGAQITPSPLVAGDRVYTPESAGQLFALDRASGEIVWSTKIDSQPFVSIDSSPVLAGNTIVIGVSSYETAIKLPDY